MMEETSMVPAVEVQVGMSEFDYSATDREVASTLRKCEAQIRQSVAQAATEIGFAFWTAQQALAGHYERLFEPWYTALGYKKRSVYRLIQRYQFVASLKEQEFPEIRRCRANVGTTLPEELAERVDSLPLCLSYEISSPSAPPELVAKVLDGEIGTLAQYRKHLKASKKPNGWLELAGSNLPKIGSAQAAAKLANAYKQQCEAIPDTLRYALTGLPLEEIKPVLWDAIYAARDAANVLEQTLVRMENDIKGGINF